MCFVDLRSGVVDFISAVISSCDLFSIIRVDYLLRVQNIYLQSDYSLQCGNMLYIPIYILNNITWNTFIFNSKTKMHYFFV